MVSVVLLFKQLPALSDIYDVTQSSFLGEFFVFFCSSHFLFSFMYSSIHASVILLLKVQPWCVIKLFKFLKIIQKYDMIVFENVRISYISFIDINLIKPYKFLLTKQFILNFFIYILMRLCYSNLFFCFFKQIEMF